MHLDKYTIAHLGRQLDDARSAFGSAPLNDLEAHEAALRETFHVLSYVVAGLGTVATRLEALEHTAAPKPFTFERNRMADLPLAPAVEPMQPRLSGLSPFERQLIVDALDILQPSEDDAELARNELIERFTRANEAIGEGYPSFSDRELMFVRTALEYLGFSDRAYTTAEGAPIALTDTEWSDLMGKLEQPGFAPIKRAPVRVVVDMTGGVFQGGSAEVPVEVVMLDYDPLDRPAGEPNYVPVAQSTGPAQDAQVLSAALDVDPAFVAGAFVARDLVDRRTAAKESSTCVQCGVAVPDPEVHKANDLMCATCGDAPYSAAEADEIAEGLIRDYQGANDVGRVAIRTQLLEMDRLYMLSRPEAYCATVEYGLPGAAGGVGEFRGYFDARDLEEAIVRAKEAIKRRHGDDVRVFKTTAFFPVGEGGHG